MSKKTKITLESGGKSVSVSGEQFSRLADGDQRRQTIIERTLKHISGLLFANWDSFMAMKDDDGKVSIGITAVIVDTGKVGITVKARAAQKFEDQTEEVWDPDQQEMELDERE